MSEAIDRRQSVLFTAIVNRIARSDRTSDRCGSQKAKRPIDEDELTAACVAELVGGNGNSFSRACVRLSCGSLQRWTAFGQILARPCQVWAGDTQHSLQSNLGLTCVS